MGRGPLSNSIFDPQKLVDVCVRECVRVLLLLVVFFSYLAFMQLDVPLTLSFVRDHGDGKLRRQNMTN